MGIVQNNVIKILSVGTQGPAGPRGDQGFQGVPFAELVTTPMLPIINNRCNLPSQPIGDLVFNMALVFTLAPVGQEQFGQFVMEEHDDVVIDSVAQQIHFLDTYYDFTGKYAVVSYLAKTTL